MGALQVGADYLIVRQVLAARRRAGIPFDQAWAHAMRMVNKDDRDVLEATKTAWHRAYLREPIYSGGAFALMADVADEHHDNAPAPTA
jgi:hypothetical protein